MTAAGTSRQALIGVVGLGHMGDAFALNLLEDGRRVVAFDRNPAHVARFREAGGDGAERLADLAACDVIVTSLTDDDVLAAVVFGEGGLAEVMRPGSIHVSMSTISPGLSRRLNAEHKARGQGYVAAPVLGNPDLARARQLFVIAAGEAGALETARPPLERLGQRLFVVGEDPGLANLMKLIGNVLTATTLQSLGEVLALARKGGIDPHVAFEVLTNSLFDGKVHRTYGGKIIDERYSPAGMTAPLAIKDLRLALAEAEHEAVPMPAASLAHDRLVGLVARGWGDLDWSALGRLAAWEAGLDEAAASPGGPDR